MKKGDVGSVLILMFVLAFAVIIVDERWLRALIAVVPALLLAQRALGMEGDEARVPVDTDRRIDQETRGSVDELLRHIREFYLTCHLMGSGKLDADDAVERVAEQELRLNRLLAEVTDGARAQAESNDLPLL